MRYRAALPLLLLCLSALSGFITGCARPLRPGDPLNGLSAKQREQFERGRTVVERDFTPETGLGPLFNASSCAECHEHPVTGGSGDEAEVHVALLRSGGFCDPLADRGGPVIQQHVTSALREALQIESEPVPGEATARAGRNTPDVFGFGLLDAVPDKRILAHADPDDRNHDGISGRPNRFFDGRLGRFGRKALVPSLREFNDGAFGAELGITNPAVPAEQTVGGKPIPAGADPVRDPEIDQKTTEDADAFVRFLAPPAPLALNHKGEHGRKLFSRLGCAACHLPVLKTGDNPVKALRHKKFAAYTDLLLHDMGPDLSDICLGLASPSEFRTEPLMGLHLMSRLLHDGRAETLEQALLLHGGEAAQARDRYKTLREEDRAALIEFLKSL